MRKKNRIIFITVVVVAIAITIAAAISLVKVVSNLTNNEEEDGIMNTTNNVENDDDDDDDDDEFYYNPHKHEGNSTLSATFTIHVTPEHYHILSWSILWGCFVVSVLFGVYQIQLEKKWLKYVTTTSKKSSHCPRSRRSNSKSPSGNHTGASGGAMIDPETGLSIRGGNHNTNRPSSSRRIIRASSRAGMGGSGRMILSASAASFNSSSNPGNLGDEQAVSSGDISRATFRRLLLLAMTSRTIAMPIQIYSDPLWIQLIADTFPVMVYATAWTWLVSFFVQLVGVALGTSTNIHGTTTTSTRNQNNQAGGTSISNGSLNHNSNNNNDNNNSNAGAGTSPYNNNNNNSPVATIGTVIQITSYTIYVLLIITFSVFRRIAAAVLLYALLCCVYATLLGTGLYFCPRLLGLLLPGLVGAGNGGGVGGESERAATEGEGDEHEGGEAQEGKQQERSQRTKQQQQNSALALRLCVCTSICLLVFAARTFCFARKVVQSTAPSSMQHQQLSKWWFVYGTLELLPGILFLIMLHPKKVGVAASSPSGSDSNISSKRNNASGNGKGDNKNNHSRSDSNIINNNDPDQPPTASSGGGRRTPPLHSYLKRSESDTSASASASALVGSSSRVSGSLGLVQPLLSSPSPSPVPVPGGGASGSSSVATYSEISPLLATTTTTYSNNNSNNNIHH